MRHILFSVLVLLLISSSCIVQNRVTTSMKQPCNRINEITILPFKGEHVDDEVYNALISMGSAAIPCLIDKVTDTTKMPDPRQAPPYDGITVGDVAFFVFLNIVQVSPETFFPADVQLALENDGIYAYFEFVQSPDQRKIIQNNLLDWYKNKYGKNVSE